VALAHAQSDRKVCHIPDKTVADAADNPLIASFKVWTKNIADCNHILYLLLAIIENRLLKYCYSSVKNCLPFQITVGPLPSPQHLGQKYRAIVIIVIGTIYQPGTCTDSHGRQ
jgi:hypothetical protein